MKYCTNCGTTLEEGVLFCPKCGNKVEMSAIEDIQPELQDIKNTQQKTETVQAAMPMEEISIGTNENLETEGKNSRIWGLVGLAAFLFLGGFGYCPWYIWIVVSILVLLTIAAMYKGAQIACSLIIILFGTPVIFGEKESSVDTSSSKSEYISTSNSASVPKWIEGKWGFKGYVGGEYYDIAVDIDRSKERILIVSNVMGTQLGSFTVSGNTLRMNDGSGITTTLDLDQSNHIIGMGGGIYLRKK